MCDNLVSSFNNRFLPECIDLPVMVTSIKVVGSGLTDLRREVTALKADSSSQLEAMEAALTNLHQNTYEMTTQMSNLEAEHANLRLVFQLRNFMPYC